jgi:hypothetical protein
MFSLTVLRTLWAILSKVQIQVGTASFEEDAARLAEARRQLESALKEQEQAQVAKGSGE